MKLLRKVFLIWLPLAVLSAARALGDEDGNFARIGGMLLRDAGALLAVLSFILYRKEIRQQTRFVFLNYAFFFFSVGTVSPVSWLIMKWLHLTDEWSEFYRFQYNTLCYFFLLLFSVVYLVLDFALRRSTVRKKYLFTMIVVGSTWGYLAYPYLSDPKYLYTTLDIQDYRAIRTAMNDLGKDGISKPTVEQIASVVKFHSPERANAQMTSEDRQALVAEILPYFRADDVSLLVLRPLWWACVAMSAVCVIFILSLILYQYLADPPGGAYVEKIVWSMLLYCSFEVLHHYAFTQVETFELFGDLNVLGWYVTLVAMVILVFLLIVRLRFIQSVEGIYYERQLASDATHITRWRDAFDNWVLRQFMDPRELNGRFLVQHKARES